MLLSITAIVSLLLTCDRKRSNWKSYEMSAFHTFQAFHTFEAFHTFHTFHIFHTFHTFQAFHTFHTFEADFKTLMVILW